ncbi:MAG TPA: hypothetical protein P5120_17445, partial [Spirochaetota bacterium]|nr:hypothetical protein [Spirochaetota bacterium]
LSHSQNIIIRYCSLPVYLSFTPSRTHRAVTKTACRLETGRFKKVCHPTDSYFLTSKPVF